jgi:hypothetical protein
VGRPWRRKRRCPVAAIRAIAELQWTPMSQDSNVACRAQSAAVSRSRLTPAVIPRFGSFAVSLDLLQGGERAGRSLARPVRSRAPLRDPTVSLVGPILVHRLLAVRSGWRRGVSHRPVMRPLRPRLRRVFGGMDVGPFFMVLRDDEIGYTVVHEFLRIAVMRCTDAAKPAFAQ